ncbi:protein kinase domain-containing protein [Acidocella sp.]|uniref:serine/threonine protein kinase n=1 Tax=Acidocella sp. TaxID=50710 RepID=UPI003D095758
MTEMLGKYELRQVLGKGAMGTVYEGYDPIIARRVAIKTVKLPNQEDEEAQEELARFKREAQAAGRLSHPNIVGVFDYGETPELAYIVMEFVDGMTLKHVLDKGERFKIPEIVWIMEGLMTGLQFSHGRGVVHRDIKPANVMLTKAGEVKIADFGIARIESSSMTQAGTMLGTPSYMSPEQFMGQTVDARTDLYSAGVLLYQLLTGEKPFDGGLTAIMHKVLHTEPPAPSALSVTVTPALDAVVKKAMAKRPDDRFSSATAFAKALREAYEAKPAPEQNFSLGADDFEDGEATMVAPRHPAKAAAAPPTPTPPPIPAPATKTGSKTALLGGGAILLLAVLGGGAYFLLHGAHKQVAQVNAAPTQPTKTQTPATQPAPQPMTPAQRQAAFVATLDSLPCTLLGANFQNGIPTLTGLAGAGAPQAALTAAIETLPNGQTLSNQIQTVDGPYCAVLDTIRPYHSLFAGAINAGLKLSLAGGKTKLYNGDLITIDQTMPKFSGYLETDYFSSDGSVLHLYPTATDAMQSFAAKATKTLGNPANGGASWQVSAPFGTDMIISIASSVPLFTTLRPQDETASAYLSALRQALQNAASNGAKIAVAAIPVITLPKNGS